MGGLRVASAAVGARPELFINNMRKVGEEKVEDARSFIATELNARNWNPRWITEMQKEGYSGAREMMKAVEYLYGWQATAPETISPTVWKKMYDVYVADEYNLGMQQFFDKANSGARQQIVARLLELDRQGTYQFSTADRQRMVSEYVRLVSQNGVACSATICGNRKLQQAVLSEARQMSKDKLSPEAVAAFEKQSLQAWRPQQPTGQVSEVKPTLYPSKSLADMLHLPMVTVSEVAEATRRYIEQNAWLPGGSALASVVLGSLFAVYRRRRPGFPPTELLLNEVDQ